MNRPLQTPAHYTKRTLKLIPVFVVVYLTILATVIFLASRFRVAAWLLFLLPIVVLGVVPGDSWSVFGIAKLIALLIVDGFINTSRFHLKGRALYVVAIFILPLLLAINILEAVISDIAASSADVPTMIPFYLNAAAGAALMLNIVMFAQSGRVSEEKYFAVFTDRIPSYLLDTPRLWVVAYTVWNINFTYAYSSNVCDYFGEKLHSVYVWRSTCACFVALVSEFVYRSSWAQSRSYSLTFDIAVNQLLCVYKRTADVVPLVEWYMSTAHWAVSGVSLGLSVLAVLWSGWHFWQQRGNPTDPSYLKWSAPSSLVPPNDNQGTFALTVSSDSVTADQH